MRKALLVVCLFSFCNLCIGQAGGSSLQIGIGMAGISYIGDLTEEKTAFNRVYPGGGITVQFAGDAIVQPYLATGFGRFTEQSDEFQFEPMPGLEPNTFVETSFFYADLRLKARLFRKKRIQPYISSGIGLTFFNPKDEEGNFLGENIFTRLEEEVYNTTIVSFPFTVGVQARLNRLLGIGLDYTYRVTPTDYLDNIGQLGTREGNDALHGIQFSMYFYLTAPEEVIKPIGEPVLEDSLLSSIPATPVDSEEWEENAMNLVTRSLDTLAANSRDLQEGSEEALRNALKDLTGDTVVPEDTGAVVVIVPETPPSGNIPSEDPEGIDWLAREKRALENRDFIYYLVKEEDDFPGIISRFKVRPVTIRSINHMVNDEIFEGSYLRLPNVGIPAR